MASSRRIRSARRPRFRGRPRAGITLVEVLVTVVVLGIAGALIIPAMGQVDVLRAQASVRTLVSDITFAQADAAATQERRAILFGAVARRQADGTVEVEEGHGYTLFAPGFGSSQVSLAFDAMPDPTNPGRPISRDFNSEVLAGGTLMDVDFDCEPQQGYQALLFDEFGGPVRDLTSDTPSEGGSLVVMGRLADYRIDVLSITGRVVVTRTPRAPENVEN